MGRHRANTSFSDSGGPMFDLTCICPSLSCVNNDTGGAFSPFFFFFEYAGSSILTHHINVRHIHTRASQKVRSPLYNIFCYVSRKKQNGRRHDNVSISVLSHGIASRRVSPVLEKQNVVITLLSWWVFFCCLATQMVVVYRREKRVFCFVGGG